MIAKKSISLTDSDHALDLLLASYFTIALLAIFVLNVYILLLLSLKVRVTFFFFYLNVLYHERKLKKIRLHAVHLP